VGRPRRQPGQENTKTNEPGRNPQQIEQLQDNENHHAKTNMAATVEKLCIFQLQAYYILMVR